MDEQELSVADLLKEAVHGSVSEEDRVLAAVDLAELRAAEHDPFDPL